MGGYWLGALTAAAQTNGIYREVYFGIGDGGAVSDLTNNPAFPNSPSLDDVLTAGFETPTDIAEGYGQRVRALLTAPTTGSYRFYIATDDGGQLFLGTECHTAVQASYRPRGWLGCRPVPTTTPPA